MVERLVCNENLARQVGLQRNHLNIPAEPRVEKNRQIPDLLTTKPGVDGRLRPTVESLLLDYSYNETGGWRLTNLSRILVQNIISHVSAAVSSVAHPHIQAARLPVGLAGAPRDRNQRERR